MLTNLNDFLKKNWKVLLIGVIFAAIRLVNIGSEEYWYDEYYNILISHKLPYREIIDYVRHVHHPPLYYLLMHPWLTIFGMGEISGRLPSLIFSLLSFALLTKLTRLFTNNKLALYMILALFTFSSLNIEFSQEARPYTLILLEYLLITYLVIKSLIYNKISSYDLFSLFFLCLFSLFTHYNQTIYLLALAASLVIVWLINRKKYGVAKIILFVIFLSFIPFLYWYMPNLRSDVTLEAYGYLGTKTRNIVLLISSLLYFYYIYFSKTLIVFSLLAVFASLFGIAWKWGKIKRNKPFLFLVILLCNSLVFVYFSPLSRIYSYSWQRHLIILHSLYLIFVPLILWIIVKGRVVRILLFFFILLFNSASLGIVLKNDTKWFYHHQYQNLVNFIESNERDGDLILVPRMTFQVMVMRYYHGKNRVTTILDDNLDVNGLPDLESADLSFYRDEDYKEHKYEENLLNMSEEYRRIWTINNYTEEDTYALDYFKRRPNWVLKTIEQFPKERLWLLTKKI